MSFSSSSGDQRPRLTFCWLQQEWWPIFLKHTHKISSKYIYIKATIIYELKKQSCSFAFGLVWFGFVLAVVEFCLGENGWLCVLRVWLWPLSLPLLRVYEEVQLSRHLQPDGVPILMEPTFPSNPKTTFHRLYSNVTVFYVHL